MNDVIFTEVSEFIKSSQFSCLGAKKTLKMDSIYIYKVDDKDNLYRLYCELEKYISEILKNHTVSSFIAVFTEENIAGENDFEVFLWKILNRLREFDSEKYNYANGYSFDINSPDFAFSLAEDAFFIVGLHPLASRISRRFKYASLVFNSHWQFEMLKKSGEFNRLQHNIRRNELKVQGSLNPHLADFGQSSEARQYASKCISSNKEESLC